MPYGPRYGRMEELPTEEQQVAARRRERKLELIKDAAKNLQLSWQVKTRYGEEVWNLLTYDLQLREELPGAIVMVDRDTDMDVKVYAPGMWFSLDTYAYVDGEWVVWQPQVAYLSDLADRLVDGEQNKA